MAQWPVGILAGASVLGRGVNWSRILVWGVSLTMFLLSPPVTKPRGAEQMRCFAVSVYFCDPRRTCKDTGGLGCLPRPITLGSGNDHHCCVSHRLGPSGAEMCFSSPSLTAATKIFYFGDLATSSIRIFEYYSTASNIFEYSVVGFGSNIRCNIIDASAVSGCM